MSVFDWFHRTPPLGRIAPLGSEHASCLAEIHASAFSRPWDVIEFERLLADRFIFADGLFLGRTSDPAGCILSRVVVAEAEILTFTIAPEALPAYS
jgi:ribosomal-protein-alanine N-acetyltransferase